MKILVLTDHKKHSEQNSVYDLIRELQRQQPSSLIEVASRGTPENTPFFHDFSTDVLHVRRVSEEFSFSQKDVFFSKTTASRKIEFYDRILLRLPRPVPDKFFPFLKKIFDENKIINRPSGIEQTSNKLFLLNYPDLCPPMTHIKSIEDIERFAGEFPIVLKPLESYSGMGLVRIDGPNVWLENEKTDRNTFFRQLEKEPFEYLGMKFLKGVHLGDKRILVCGDVVLGATLRLPPEDSWICNISHGGSAIAATLDEREQKMVERLIPDMKNHGVLIYGMDTLSDEDGTRYLSEINTLSPGGISPAQRSSNTPVVQSAARGIWDYILKTKNDGN